MNNAPALDADVVPIRRPRLSRPMSRLSFVLAVLVMLTSSFDLVLIMQAGGNFRFCQLAAAVLFVLAIVRVWRSGKVPTLGALSLCVWLFFQVLFIPVSEFWPKSVGYCLWLAFNAATVFSFVQVFSDDLRAVRTLLRWYV